MRIDAVLFDLDGTLCRYRRSTEDLLAESFEAVGADLFPPEAYYERFDDFLGEHEDMATFRAACFADAAAAHGSDPDLAREAAAVFEARRDQRAVDPLDGAREAVCALADDHAVGLVTNGPPATQRTKLDAIGLADAFDATVFAGFDAPTKPTPEPFELACEALDVPAERAVHVGNSPAADVAGARAAGLRAVWLREDGREPDRPPDWTVDAPADLLDPPWR